MYRSAKAEKGRGPPRRGEGRAAWGSASKPSRRCRALDATRPAYACNSTTAPALACGVACGNGAVSTPTSASSRDGSCPTTTHRDGVYATPVVSTAPGTAARAGLTQRSGGGGCGARPSAAFLYPTRRVSAVAEGLTPSRRSSSGRWGSTATTTRPKLFSDSTPAAARRRTSSRQRTAPQVLGELQPLAVV